MTIQVSSPSQLENGNGATPSQDSYLSGLISIRQPLVTDVRQPNLTSALQDIRDAAADQVRSLSFPSKRDEEWRFTDLSPIRAVNFQPAGTSTRSAEWKDAVQSYLLDEAAGCQLVFVDGQLNADLSQLDNVPEGVTVTGLAGLGDRPDAAQSLTTFLNQQGGLEKTFTALNTASFTDIAVILVDKHVVAPSPIQVLFVSTAGDQPIITHPRCLVVAEANSEVTVIEDFVAVGEGTSFTNAVTEISVHDNAQVHHT
ncbi:MAG: SufD family Fe-S cluster assembly protein, partial [Leptolyngbyaceae bacterium]|nr:SufD family Fe-S cluster assembly protein [Leptolyngbyaceae bacterium]